MAYLNESCCGDCQTHGLAGMGESQTVNEAASIGGTATGLVATLGVMPVFGAVAAAAVAVVILLNKVLNVGAGRKEADLITSYPSSGGSVQNTIGNFLVTVNNEIPTASVTQLQGFASAMYQVAQKFMAFLTSPLFKDGRASEQALNTIMPLIDGTCGYKWAGAGVTMQPSEENCGPAGGGEQGTLGSISRQIQRLTGNMPSYAQIFQGGGSAIPSLGINPTSPIPQAGTLPAFRPNTPLGNYAGIQPVGGSGLPSSSILLGLAGWLFLRR